MLELLICVNKLKSCLKESMVSLQLNNSCDNLFSSFLTLDCSSNMSKSHSTSVVPAFFNLSLRRPWMVAIQILEILFLDYSKVLQKFPLFNCQLIFPFNFQLAYLRVYLYIFVVDFDAKHFKTLVSKPSCHVTSQNFSPSSVRGRCSLNLFYCHT